MYGHHHSNNAKQKEYQAQDSYDYNKRGLAHIEEQLMIADSLGPKTHWSKMPPGARSSIERSALDLLYEIDERKKSKLIHPYYLPKNLSAHLIYPDVVIYSSPYCQFV